MLITRLTSSSFCCIFALNIAIEFVPIQANSIRSHSMKHLTGRQTTLADLLGSASSSILSTYDLSSPYNSDNSERRQDSNEFREGKFLDDEDKRLLDQFYRETKESDPFLSNNLSIESLWSEDNQRKKNKNAPPSSGVNQSDARIHNSTNDEGWTYDESIVDGLNGRPYEYNLGPTIEDALRANYSPPIDLLTSYNPLQSDFNMTQPDEQMDLLKSSNRIVGATLFGRDQNSRPDVSSKSAQEAIRLHNDLLRRPQNDGKVRVRMYYHRAIHDDAKLYGTGPWKYWGHGWGLEFGYDPRKRDKDFYQRGYTIERAFGRDFCKDNKNCRKSDPNFFKDPNQVGKYSEQYFNGIKKTRASST